MNKLYQKGSYLAALATMWGFGSKKDDSNSLYVTKADKGININVVEAFGKDFPEGVKMDEIGKVVEHLCQNDESLNIKRLSDGGYSGQIVRPIGSVEVTKGGFFGGTTHQHELPHPIEISNLNIYPDSKYGYGGNLSFYDAAKDLHSFLVAVDGEIHKEGIFVKLGSMGLLGEFLGRTELSVSIDGSPLEVKAEKMPLGCIGDDNGNLYGFSGGGVRKFGNIPTGQHELMFYAMDKKGNRSFAITKYDV